MISTVMQNEYNNGNFKGGSDLRLSEIHNHVKSKGVQCEHVLLGDESWKEGVLGEGNGRCKDLEL